MWLTSSFNTTRRSVISFMVLCFFCATLAQMNTAELEQHFAGKVSKMTRLLQTGRCKHVYFDLGSNVGVQIRKLYQPRHFSHAKVLPIFSKYFGHGHRRDVCAFGFEPNSVHTKTLDVLEESYTAAGYPVVIFTHTAISNTTGIMTFYREPLTDPSKHEFGSSLLRFRNDLIEEKAFVANFAQLMRDTIVSHYSTSAGGHIIAKMDIEGAEYAVLPSLLNDGLICWFSMMMMEYHPGKGFSRNFPREYEQQIRQQAGCNTIMLALDDETYNAGGDNIPFPPAAAAALEDSVS